MTESIKFVGADDRDIDLFEGQYPVPDGISYNSYVIFDEKITVMDTVDRRKADEFLENLEKTLGERKPDLIVVSHVEPDHASSLGAFMEKYPETTVVGNAKTFQMLQLLFGKEPVESWKKLTVKDGDTLSTGKNTLKFITSPMVHWPEVMFTWVEQESVLFSADAFGTFALHEGDGWDDEARRYYCNIVGKYGPQVMGALKKIENLPIRTVCPLHGPVLEENLDHCVELYKKWAAYVPENPNAVMIAYASLHGNTAGCAQLMKAELEQLGASVEVVDLARTEISEAIAQGFRCGKWLLMSSTYNTALVPAMDNFLREIAGKNIQQRTVALGENGMWAPSAVKNMTATLSAMKGMTILEKSITLKGSVKEENMQQLRETALALFQA